MSIKTPEYEIINDDCITAMHAMAAEGRTFDTDVHKLQESLT